MNKTKVGLLAVTAAGAMAVAIAHSAGTSPPAAKPATTGPAPARAIPVAPPPGATATMTPAATPAVPAAPAGPAGKAEIKELVFDAGTIERGADINHAFTIRNVGKHDLTVDAKPG